MGLGNDSLDITPKEDLTKAKQDKWDQIKFRNLCESKEAINKDDLWMGEIFTGLMCTEELISRRIQQKKPTT